MLQRITTAEGGFADGLERIGQRDAADVVTIAEGEIGNGRDAFGNIDLSDVLGIGIPRPPGKAMEVVDGEDTIVGQ